MPFFAYCLTFQELHFNKKALEKVLDLIEQELSSDKMATGRPGLSLW